MTLLNDRRENVSYGKSSCNLTAFAKIYMLMSRTIVNDEFGRMEKGKWSN